MAEDKKPAPAAPVASGAARLADNTLIVRPIITERSTQARERLGKYTFEIVEKATKADVRGAVERIFGVKVRKVNLLRRHGKQRRVRAVIGKTSDTRRAIVTVEPGQKIAFFEGL
ncbi:50S ribosomal protein L23 [bacterium]|nr:50S ribosomal protein L23 [bacterium]